MWRALLGVVVGATSYATISTSYAADRAVVILQSLTGPGAFLGVPLSEGMKYAASEINQKGFLGPDKLIVSVVDDASDRGQTTTTLTRAAADPANLMVLGPTIAPTAIPAAGVANQLKIPTFSLPNVPDIIGAGPWSFIAMQPATNTMTMLGTYVVDRLAVKNCAMISLTDNEAYVNFVRIFRESVEPKGVKFVDLSGVRSTDSDFSAVSTRVASLNPDCVFLFTTAPVAANLAIQLKQAGLSAKTRLIGTNALASPQLVKIGGAAVEGVVFFAEWVPGGSTPTGKAFAEGYKKATGIDPDNWAALGYSFMYVAATAIKNAGPNPTRETVREALERTKDVPVIVGAGTYSLDPKRFPSMGINFLTVKSGNIVQAD